MACRRMKLKVPQPAPTLSLPLLCSSSSSSALQATEGLRDMNAMFAARGPSALPNTSAPTPTLAKRLKELRSDRQLAPLLSAYTAGGASGALGRAGGPDSAPPAEPAPGVGGNYSWGSAAMPWEVAAAGQEFVRDHVRMQDALAYIR